VEQGSTFPWYELSHLSVLLSNCVGCMGDFPLPMGQPPLSPIDLHLQLFLRESAYLSHSSLAALFFLGDASHRQIPSFIFSFASPPEGLPLPISTKGCPGFPGYRVRGALYYHVRRE